MQKQIPCCSDCVHGEPLCRGRILAARWLIVVIVAFAAMALTARQAQAQGLTPGCELGACVTIVRSAGISPTLESAEIAGTQSVLQFDPSDTLDALFSTLTGNTIDLETSDHEALMLVNFELGELLGQLQTDLGLDSPQAVLTADVTLDQLFTALAAVTTDANADTALDKLVTAIDRTEPIQLGDWLQDDSSDGAISNVSLNLMDFVMGSIQLFNYANVHTVPDAITLELDRGAVLQLQAQAVEPPLMICGPEGSQFYSAAMRFASSLDNFSIPFNDLETPIGMIDVFFERLSVFAEIGRGLGVIELVDVISDVVTIEATPGSVELYAGTIDEAVFFDRTHTIDPATDLDYETIGRVEVPESAQPGAVQTFDLDYKSFAASGPITPTLLTFDPPHPGAVQSASAGSGFAGNLLQMLTDNLDVVIDLSSLGADPSDVQTAIDTIVGAMEQSGVPAVIIVIGAGGLTRQWGIGFGQMAVQVLGTCEVCPALTVEKTHEGTFAAGETGEYTITVTNTGVITPSSPITVVDTLPPGFSYAAHSGEGWNLEGAPGSSVTFVNSTPLSPTSTLPPLVLTVNIAQNLTGTLTNTVTVTTTGNINEDNTAFDPTQVIDGDPDDDDDGVPDVDDSAPDDPCVPNPQAGACDQDGDGLTNAQEEELGTVPTNPDTDGDGFDDGTEVSGETDPLDPCDPNPESEACPSEPPPPPEGQVSWLPIIFHFEPDQELPFRE